MQGVIATRAQIGIDGDEVLHPAHLAGQDDMIATEPDRLGTPGAFQGRDDQGLAGHLARVSGLAETGVVVHHTCQELAVQAAPVDADAHRPVVADGGFYHGRELAVALVLETDVAGVDAVFRQALGTVRIAGEQEVAVVMKIADQRDPAARGIEQLADPTDLARRFLGVDRDAHQLRARRRQGLHLAHGSQGVGRVGVGHRLHHDGVAAPDGDRAHLDADAVAPQR
jgi:hypothetical protein